MLTVIRRNLLNVFSQLSRASDEQKEQNPIMALPIRGGLISEDYGAKASPSASLGDASSLLFYYLFDDWYTTYSLVARKQHQYNAQLEHLVGIQSVNVLSVDFRLPVPSVSKCLRKRNSTT